MTEGEFVVWCGVPMFLHRFDDHGGHIKMIDRFGCTHEPTGWLIGRGPTAETALAVAIEKLRRNWEQFHAQVAVVPVINPQD